MDGTQVLEKALFSFGGGEGWCKGAFGRNEEGQDCYVGDAYQCCARGAIRRAAIISLPTEYAEFDPAYMEAERRLSLEIPEKYAGIVDWNDHKDTTFPVVRETFLRAIASAESEVHPNQTTLEVGEA